MFVIPPAEPPEFRGRDLNLAVIGEPVVYVGKGLGIREGNLRRWMAQDDVDSGRDEGLTSIEKRDLVKLRRKTRGLEMENEILKHTPARFARNNAFPKVVFRFAHEMAAQGYPVAETCRVVGVSKSGF